MITMCLADLQAAVLCHSLTASRLIQHMLWYVMLPLNGSQRALAQVHQLLCHRQAGLAKGYIKSTLETENRLI